MELYSYVENRETTVRVRTAFHAKHREFAIRNTHTAGHGAHAVERGAARAHGPGGGAHRQSPDAKPKAPPTLASGPVGHSAHRYHRRDSESACTVWHTRARGHRVYEYVVI